MMINYLARIEVVVNNYDSKGDIVKHKTLSATSEELINKEIAEFIKENTYTSNSEDSKATLIFFESTRSGNLEEKAKRLGVKLIKPSDYDRDIIIDTNPTVAICGLCGLEIKKVMAYACQERSCPVQPKSSY